MLTTFTAFLIGLAAYLIVDVVASHLSGETGFSFPAAALLVGFLCAITAHFLHPLAAVAVFALVTLVRANEVWQDRKNRDHNRRPPPSP